MIRIRTLLPLLVAGVPACLSVPDGPAPECETTDDCDGANGEVCGEGTCWGNPPAGTFAAVLSPPSDRKDLVAREIAQLAISQDGWLPDLQLETPVTLAGRIEATCAPLPAACDRTTLGATITVTRASRFMGGPGFKTVATSEADASGPSFEVTLPASLAGEQYTLTIVPTGRGDEPPSSGNGLTAGQLVPPARLRVEVGYDLTKLVELGGDNLPTIDGTLVTSTGVGLSHHRVVALGRWEPGAPLTEVSTVFYTGADGAFRLVLSDKLVGNVEIVAKPYGDAPAPTLHLAGVSATTSSTKALVQPTDLGEPYEVTIPIRGLDGSGEITPARGARVKVTATVPPVVMGGTSATFSAEGTTDDSGNVKLPLLDGLGIRELYKLEVVPLAAAKTGVMFDEALPLYQVQAPLILPTRVAMTGVVTDVLGNPLKDVAVTARPSLRFVWSLSDIPQAFLSAVPAATTTTSSAGEFVLWVDPTVAGVWGHYDLVFEPSIKTRAPTFVKTDVEIPRNIAVSAVNVTQIQLPDAAYIHGQVTDDSGELVKGAELKVFRTLPGTTLCDEVQNAPLGCPVPATLLGRGASDDDGMARLSLPR